MPRFLGLHLRLALLGHLCIVVAYLIEGAATVDIALPRARLRLVDANAFGISNDLALPRRLLPPQVRAPRRHLVHGIVRAQPGQRRAGHLLRQIIGRAAAVVVLQRAGHAPILLEAQQAVAVLRRHARPEDRRDLRLAELLGPERRPVDKITAVAAAAVIVLAAAAAAAAAAARFLHLAPHEAQEAEKAGLAVRTPNMRRRRLLL